RPAHDRLLRPGNPAGRDSPLRQPGVCGADQQALVRGPVRRHRHDRPAVLDFPVRAEGTVSDARAAGGEANQEGTVRALRGRGGGRASRLAGATARGGAVNAGKTVRFMSRALGRGGGTPLPGNVAARIDPGLVAGLARALPNGCVLITGTNGKTTTTRIMAGAARAAGLEVITNPEGSNMLSRIATSLLVHANRLGI